MALLTATEVSKSFGGIRALSDVDLSVDEGEAVGIVGPNGAGKSTLFDCLLGIQRLDGGHVRFDGRDLAGLAVYRRARLGIGRTFQRLELFVDLSARQHLLVAQRAHAGHGGLIRDLLNRGGASRAELAAVDSMLDLLELRDVADVPAQALTLGRGRLVELGRALMTEPKLLMLDEPSSGLNRSETAALASVLERVGTAVLLVEHDLEMVRQVATRLYVLDFGQVICEGPTSSVLTDPRVRTAYLGIRGMTAPLLALDRVFAGYGAFQALFGVSLAVQDGQAVALVGPNGAGKSTIARVASGLVPVTSGVIRIDGKDVTGVPAWRLARLGISHAPEGRSTFASLTVAENLELSFRAGAAGASALERAYAAFPKLRERRRQLAGTLSGGEQRMLSLCKVLANPPRLLIIDELSLGLSPIVTDSVFTMLRDVRDTGTALLIIEQHVDRVLQIADHVVVLAKGEVVEQGPVTRMADVATQLVPLHHG